jgi:hypothetical protein
MAMTTSAAGESAPSAATGKAGRVRNLGGWLTRWWSKAPDGRTYQRRRAGALVAAAGLGVVVVRGVLVAHQLVLGTDVALFRRINHWPGWLYPPMWAVRLSGVIGALLLVAAAAALLRRLRLVAATLLKVLMEDVTKKFVQRDRPAQTLPDVILRGKSAAQSREQVWACSSGRGEPRIRRARRQPQHYPRRRITVSSYRRLAWTS